MLLKGDLNKMMKNKKGLSDGLLFQKKSFPGNQKTIIVEK